jgi:hypothetical protein
MKSSNTDYLEQHDQASGDALREGSQNAWRDRHGFGIRQTGPAQMPLILFEDDPDFRIGYGWSIGDGEAGGLRPSLAQHVHVRRTDGCGYRSGARCSGRRVQGDEDEPGVAQAAPGAACHDGESRVSRFRRARGFLYFSMAGLDRAT